MASSSADGGDRYVQFFGFLWFSLVLFWLLLVILVVLRFGALYRCVLSFVICFIFFIFLPPLPPLGVLLPHFWCVAFVKGH